MRATDPFSQLEQYMRAQKANAKPRVVSMRQVPLAAATPPAKPEASPPTHAKVLNAIELRAVRSKQQAPVEKLTNKQEPKGARRMRASSPLNNPNVIRRNPILPDEQLEAEGSTITHHSRTGCRMTPSRSQKSYDFVGEQNEEEKDLQKIRNRKTTLVRDYKASADHWNRETPSVFSNLVSDLDSSQQKLVEKSLSGQAYEDPRLTRMKNIMQYHKEKLGRKDSNAVLKGVSNHDSRRALAKDALGPLREENDAKTKPKFESIDRKTRNSHNVSDIFFQRENEGNANAREVSRSQGRRPVSVNNVFQPTEPPEVRPSVRKTSPLKYKYDITSHIEGLNHPNPSEQVAAPLERGRKHFKEVPGEAYSFFFREFFQKREGNVASMAPVAPVRPQPVAQGGHGGHGGQGSQQTRESLMDEYRRKIAMLE